MAFSLIRYVSGSRPSILVSGFRQLNFFFRYQYQTFPFGSTDCVVTTCVLYRAFRPDAFYAVKVIKPGINRTG